MLLELKFFKESFFVGKEKSVCLLHEKHENNGRYRVVF